MYSRISKGQNSSWLRVWNVREGELLCKNQSLSASKGWRADHTLRTKGKASEMRIFKKIGIGRNQNKVDSDKETSEMEPICAIPNFGLVDIVAQGLFELLAASAFLPL